MLLFACTEPHVAELPEQADSEEVVVESEPPADSPTDSVDSEGPPDSDAPEVTEETVPDQEADDGWIFDDTTVHEIAITLPTASTNGLINEPHTYVEGSVEFDGYELETVGVRIRGKIGSLRPLSGKPKFKVDFNQYVEDQRFFGLETLSLNAGGVVDCSFIKENLAYQLFRDAGIAAPRTGFARLSVNGADYGLYILIETPDDRFLKRTQEDPDGNLYDGKYAWYGGYSYTLLDFGLGVDTLFQLEEGTDVGHADITAVSTALNTYKGTPGFYNDMAAVLDWDQFLMFQAVEQYIGQNDGYGLNRNNYRVYFDPEDGLAEFVPWDMDYSFLYDYQWGRSWSSPTGTIAYWCMADSACYSERRQASKDLLSVATSSDLVTKLDEMVAVIHAEIASDPRRECAESSALSEQARVRAWLEGQNATMEGFWGF